MERYEDYPELLSAGFSGELQPVMRAHGEKKPQRSLVVRRQAEPILEKYLRLRYQLLPYTYSLAYRATRRHSFMRALFMDFPDDPNVADIRTNTCSDQPYWSRRSRSKEQQAARSIYLQVRIGITDWTNERIKGGQTITVAAPIDTIPLFVRAGSIVPLGTRCKALNNRRPLLRCASIPGRMWISRSFQMTELPIRMSTAAAPSPGFIGMRPPTA